MLLADVEGLATAVLEERGLSAPINPFRLADALGVEVVDGLPGCRSRAELGPDGWRVVLDPRARPERRASRLCHELGHPLAQAAGLPAHEDVAWWIGMALLMPRANFMRLRRRHGRCVERIVDEIPWASHEAVGRRFVMIEPTLRLWVWDREGPRTRRYTVQGPAWTWPRTRKPLPVELEAMDAAFEDGEPVEPIGGVRAWRVVDGPWVRILCLSDGEVLADRPHAWSRVS